MSRGGNSRVVIFTWKQHEMQCYLKLYRSPLSAGMGIVFTNSARDYFIENILKCIGITRDRPVEPSEELPHPGGGLIVLFID